jgi:SAM-dependent methyltransferase
MLRQGTFLARPGFLPMRSGSVSSIACLDVLEYVSGDDRVVDELARVLRPGGVLRLRVPATGLLAGIDAYNLMHYLVDTSRRGVRPHEIAEVGWRRHYGLGDIEDMLGRDRFTVRQVRRRGLAAAEIVKFAAMVLFRWQRPNQDRYLVTERLAYAIEQFESRIVTPVGFRLEIEAQRLP